MPYVSARGRKRLPRKDSRTIPIPGNVERGDGQDEGRYHHCWNCGFICDGDRDSLGGAQGRSGVGFAIYDAMYSGDNSGQAGDPIDGQNSGIPLTRMCVWRSPATYFVAMENGIDGEPKAIKRNWEPDVVSGCPFCGTRNWRGDY